MCCITHQDYVSSFLTNIGSGGGGNGEGSRIIRGRHRFQIPKDLEKHVLGFFGSWHFIHHHPHM